jgi:hypothetical protein
MRGKAKQSKAKGDNYEGQSKATKGDNYEGQSKTKQSKGGHYEGQSKAKQSKAKKGDNYVPMGDTQITLSSQFKSTMEKLSVYIIFKSQHE